MDKLDWTGSYNIGHLAIDDQHKHLRDLLNKVAELDLSNPNARSQCHSILEKLKEDAMQHFAYEESVLRKAKAENLSSQIAEHNKFYIMLRNIMVKLRANEISIPELHSQLTSVFETHFQEEQQIKLHS